MTVETTTYESLRSFCTRHGLFMHAWCHEDGWTCFVVRANDYVCQGNGETRELAARQALPKAQRFVGEAVDSTIGAPEQ